MPVQPERSAATLPTLIALAPVELADQQEPPARARSHMRGALQICASRRSRGTSVEVMTCSATPSLYQTYVRSVWHFDGFLSARRGTSETSTAPPSPVADNRRALSSGIRSAYTRQLPDGPSRSAPHLSDTTSAAPSRRSGIGLPTEHPSSRGWSRARDYRADPRYEAHASGRAPRPSVGSVWETRHRLKKGAL